MSSTNRGTIRRVNDSYNTPTYTILSILNVHKISYPAFEPCAGEFAIVHMLDSKQIIYTNDIEANSPSYTHHDYLHMEFPSKDIKTVITNPPFNIAREVIEKSLRDIKKGGEVIMLLRLNFLGAQKRKEFWNKVPLKQVYVLSKRPCFINGKSDSIEYAWFVFEKGFIGEAGIKVI